jgi:hypothetical protein
MRHARIMLALFALMSAGCSSSSTSTMNCNPFCTVPSVVFVNDFAHSLATVSMPVTSSSTITIMTPAGLSSPDDMKINGPMRELWVLNDATTLVGYSLPVSSASTPFATIRITGAVNPVGLAIFGPNLWVADGGAGKIYEYVGPFSGASTPVPAVTLSSISDPVGLAFDNAGNLYVASFTTNTVEIFSPPFVTGQSPNAAALTGLNDPYDITFDAAGNLYAINFLDGSIARFNAPTAGGGAPSTIIPSAVTGIGEGQSLAFDGSGNLYAADALNTNNLYIFANAASAFSATLAPTKVPVTGFKMIGGITVGTQALVP